MLPLRLSFLLALSVPIAGGASPHAAGLEGRAYALGSALGAMIPRPAPAPVPTLVLEEELLPIFSDSPVLVTDEIGKAKSKSKSKSGRKANGIEAKFIHVSAATVLRLAERGRAPTGRPVSSAGARPAGIRLAGVASLGIGLAEGDVLVEVEGRGVTAPAEVIAAVIGARARHQPTMSGKLYRGREVLFLTVEMPYLPAREHVRTVASLPRR